MPIAIESKCNGEIIQKEGMIFDVNHEEKSIELKSYSNEHKEEYKFYNETSPAEAADYQRLTDLIELIEESEYIECTPEAFNEQLEKYSYNTYEYEDEPIDEDLNENRNSTWSR